MNKRGGKRKRDVAGAIDQPKEQDHGLVTDTNYHTGSLFSRTFQQIYEDYRSNKVPEDEEERDTWQKVKRSGLPFIVARPAIFPYPDMVNWILSRC